MWAVILSLGYKLSDYLAKFVERSLFWAGSSCTYLSLPTVQTCSDEDKFLILCCVMHVVSYSNYTMA